ncbi:hypothetical protein M9434_001144 [Picochlorum sp. BPE23]|nr:hypothetical protein M9434_001144 [Picochlorum sp. BPE23]
MRAGRCITAVADVQRIARSARVVAVLGIKPESKSDQPAFFVPQFLMSQGVRIIPVPTYYPDVTEILGQPVVRSLKEIRCDVDILDVFRPPSALPGHMEEILALRPACVWLQVGIRHEEFESELMSHGIDVVVDKCLKVELQHASRL